MELALSLFLLLRALWQTVKRDFVLLVENYFVQFGKFYKTRFFFLILFCLLFCIFCAPCFLHLFYCASKVQRSTYSTPLNLFFLYHDQLLWLTPMINYWCIFCALNDLACTYWPTAMINVVDHDQRCTNKVDAHTLFLLLWPKVISTIFDQRFKTKGCTCTLLYIEKISWFFCLPLCCALTNQVGHKQDRRSCFAAERAWGTGNAQKILLAPFVHLLCTGLLFCVFCCACPFCAPSVQQLRWSLGAQ